MPRPEAADLLLKLLRIPGIVLPGKAALTEVMTLWVQTPRLSYADCNHLVAARQLGLNSIITFDRGMNVLPDVRRLEPPLDNPM